MTGVASRALSVETPTQEKTLFELQLPPARKNQAETEVVSEESFVGTVKKEKKKSVRVSAKRKNAKS